MTELEVAQRQSNALAARLKAAGFRPAQGWPGFSSLVR